MAISRASLGGLALRAGVAICLVTLGAAGPNSSHPTPPDRSVSPACPKLIAAVRAIPRAVTAPGASERSIELAFSAVQDELRIGSHAGGPVAASLRNLDAGMDEFLAALRAQDPAVVRRSAPFSPLAAALGDLVTLCM